MASRELDSLKAGSGEGLAPKITYHNHKQCKLDDKLAKRMRFYLKNVEHRQKEKKKQMHDLNQSKIH